MDTRVFWSVLCALLVFSGLIVFFLAAGVSAQRQVVLQVQQTTQQNIARIAEQARQEAVEQEAQREAYERSQLERRRLASNQSCVGGVVIEVRGTSYTQLGDLSHPVHCSGAFADQPLR